MLRKKDSMKRLFPLLMLLSGVATMSAEDWPRWRGPMDSGSAAGGEYPDKPLEAILWKIPLPGKGCSTPIVWQRQIFLTAPIEGQDAVLAYDWAGKKLWQLPIGAEIAGKHRNGSGGNASPTTDGKFIFVSFKSGVLAALTLEGKLLWKTNLQERFGRDTLYWDAGTSPVITRAHVVMTVMHEGDSFLAAFDKQTGEMAWKTARKYKTPPENDHGYTTPIVVTREGREEIVTWGAEHLTAHNAADGKQLWESGGFNPEGKRNWVAVASAIIVDGMAVVPHGRGTLLAGVKLGGTGDVTEKNRVWTRTDTGSFVPTPAAAEGRVYLVRDRGEVVCLDARTGKTVWEGRFPENRNSYYSSPSIAGGKIYSAREDGVLFVARCRDKFEFVSENDMGERIVASPVPIQSRLLLRGEKHLFCAGRQ